MHALAYMLLLLIFALPAAYATNEGSKTAKPQSKQPNPLDRATQEFKILTRDRGMRPGSPPSAKMQHRKKMLWHGRVYENFRNDVLDAIPHEVKQNGGIKSPLRRNQFGFNVSGPLLIPHLIENPNNTFFMLSYEGVREHIYRASLHTVPTLLQRHGDFSQTVDQAGHPLPIYDPTTTRPNPNYNPDLPVSTSNLQYLRSTFPGNVIPPDRLEPEIQQALSLYSLPNTDVGPFFQNNYFVNAPAADTADGIILKIDHPIRDRHRVTSLTTISNGFLGAAKYFPNIASPTAPDQHFSSWRTQLDYVYTASSRTVNTASLTVASHTVQSGDSSQVPFPRYQLSGYLSMGTSFPNSHNVQSSFEFRDQVSTRKGKHSPHLTFEVGFNRVNSFDPAYPSGYFQFSAGLTSLPGIINTGDPFASFLLGLSDYGERTIITSPSYFRDSYELIAAGDSYEVTKNLTITLDLRLRRRTPRIEKYNRQSTVDPLVIDPSNGYPGALVFAGRNGIPRGMRNANVDLDPSVGVAWNPRGDANTVVRASFSRSHGHIPIYNNQWGTQGFNARQNFISPNVQLTPALNLAGGIPPYTTPLPDINPSAADNTVADFVDLSGREPVYQSASFSVEHQIPFSMVITVGTDYSHGWNILVGNSAANPNAINPRFLSLGNALYNEAFRVTLQPYPQYKGFELYGLYPAGRYQSNVGFVRVEKRASFGLTFTAYYAFSRQYDDYSGPYGNQDLLNLRNNWARSPNDPPQHLQLSYIYEPPFASSQRLFYLSEWQRILASGWSISGMGYWNGGTPLAIHPQFNYTGGVLSTLYANVVPGVDPHVANPGPSQWFNPAAFAQPADFTMGNAPRTLADLMGPGFNSFDLSLNKRVPIGGDNAIEFNATAFNFLNHGNWNYPDTNIGPADAPNVNAGKIIDSRGSRVIELGLKFNF